MVILNVIIWVILTWNWNKQYDMYTRDWYVQIIINPVLLIKIKYGLLNIFEIVNFLGRTLSIQIKIENKSKLISFSKT